MSHQNKKFHPYSIFGTHANSKSHGWDTETSSNIDMQSTFMHNATRHKMHSAESLSLQLMDHASHTGKKWLAYFYVLFPCRQQDRHLYSRKLPIKPGRNKHKRCSQHGRSWISQHLQGPTKDTCQSIPRRLTYHTFFRLWTSTNYRLSLLFFFLQICFLSTKRPIWVHSPCGQYTPTLPQEYWFRTTCFFENDRQDWEIVIHLCPPSITSHYKTALDMDKSTLNMKWVHPLRAQYAHSTHSVHAHNLRLEQHLVCCRLHPATGVQENEKRQIDWSSLHV